MMVDTTIYGYAIDGAVFHPRCLDGESPDPTAGAIHALYYLDDEDPHGMSCDGCGKYIFEPVEKHDAADCTYGCDDYCGESESCWLHEPEDGQVLIAGVLYDRETLEEANPIEIDWRSVINELEA